AFGTHRVSPPRSLVANCRSDAGRSLVPMAWRKSATSRRLRRRPSVASSRTFAKRLRRARWKRASPESRNSPICCGTRTASTVYMIVRRRRLIVVRRDAPELFRQLEALFSGTSETQVIADRRTKDHPVKLERRVNANGMILSVRGFFAASTALYRDTV